MLFITVKKYDKYLILDQMNAEAVLHLIMDTVLCTLSRVMTVRGPIKLPYVDYG